MFLSDVMPLLKILNVSITGITKETGQNSFGKLSRLFNVYFTVMVEELLRCCLLYDGRAAGETDQVKVVRQILYILKGKCFSGFSMLSYGYETVTDIICKSSGLYCKRLLKPLKHSTDSDIITSAG